MISTDSPSLKAPSGTHPDEHAQKWREHTIKGLLKRGAIDPNDIKEIWRIPFWRLYNLKKRDKIRALYTKPPPPLKLYYGQDYEIYSSNNNYNDKLAVLPPDMINSGIPKNNHEDINPQHIRMVEDGEFEALIADLKKKKGQQNRGDEKGTYLTRGRR